MQGFIALVWAPRDRLATEHARKWGTHLLQRRQPWQRVLDIAGFQLHTAPAKAGPQVRLLDNGTGAILGALYRRSLSSKAASIGSQAHLSRADSARILATDGEDLIHRYWGDYAALLLDRSLNVRVLRGPASNLLCLRTELHRVHIWFSDMDSVARLVGEPFAIDWMSLARTWLGPEATPRTHLDAVTELLPGECHETRLDGTSRTALLWQPLEIARLGYRGTRDQAIRELKATIEHCTRARACSADSVLVALSGGLDSSVTLAALATGKPRTHLTGLNQFGQDEESDERVYARLVAEQHQCELIETPREATLDLRDSIHQRCTELSPGLRIRSVERIEADVAHRVHAQLIFRGDGGDEIFCRNALHWYVVDYLKAQRSLRGAGQYVLHAAMAEGITVWQVLARAITQSIMRRSPAPSPESAESLAAATLLHPEILKALIESTPQSPYLPHASAVSPGRAWQIRLMTARRRFTGPFDEVGDPPRVAPLLSQPLMELCLRLPTWYQMSSFQDRAMVREAFAQELPAAVLARRGKGGAERLARAILGHNRAFIREMLLEGLLAQSGILDRARLAALLAEESTAASVSSVPLFDVLGAEIWARAWQKLSRLSRQANIEA